MNSDISDEGDWGSWSEDKLNALGSYLELFVRATQSIQFPAKKRIYLDLFAGSAVNRAREDNTRTFDGSAVRALKTIPQFTHLRFFDLEGMAQSLEKDLQAMFKDDERFEVARGDCNSTIHSELKKLKNLRLQHSPTIAFIDPRGLHFKWETLKALADYKEPNFRGKRYRTEMLVLLFDGTIQRLYGKDLSQPEQRESSQQATALFGNEDWKLIADRRRKNDISAPESRFYYVKLFRHQLEKTLGYKTTMALPFKSTTGTPQYSLVFATDHDAGKNIMEWVFGNTAEALFEDRISAQLKQEQEKRLGKGNPSLFDSQAAIEDEDTVRWMRQFTVQEKKLRKDELIASPAEMPAWFRQAKHERDSKQNR